jgi:hypothetical protein
MRSCLYPVSVLLDGYGGYSVVLVGFFELGFAFSVWVQSGWVSSFVSVVSVIFSSQSCRNRI